MRPYFMVKLGRYTDTFLFSFNITSSYTEDSVRTEFIWKGRNGMNKAETNKPKVVKPKKGDNGGSTGSSFDNVELFLLHLPTTIWYIVFCYAPIFGIIIAFKNFTVAPGRNFLYSLFINSPFTGLQNFRFLFNSSFFSTMIRNTLVYNIIF